MALFLYTNKSSYSSFVVINSLYEEISSINLWFCEIIHTSIDKGNWSFKFKEEPDERGL